MDKVRTIDVYAARLLMMCLFLPERLQPLVLIGMSAYFVYRTIAIKTFPPVSNYLWALIIGSGYLLYVFAVPLTAPQYRHEVSTFCERRVSFLLMPFIFAFIAPVFRKVITGEIMYFVYGTFITCALGNADYFYHYFFVNGGLHHFSHVDYRNIFENFTGIHPTYMGLYLAFSICILLFSDAPNDTRARVFKYVFFYVLMIFLLSLLAKAPLIALVLIFIHYAWLRRRELRQYRLLIALMLGCIIIASVSIPFARQRLAELPQFIGMGKPGNSAENSFYDREMIFSTDMAMFRHYWLTGTGPGRLLSQLNMRYFFHSITQNRAVGYFDPHNEYFFQWLSFGVLGIVLLAAILLIHVIRALHGRDYVYLYLLAIVSITFFTETVLGRQQGVLFYALFTSFFFFRKAFSSLKPQPIQEL